MSMTIRAFSAKTGLPTSTLRYYDRKKLLSPAKRQENGYRLYLEEQIPEALMIHSLRQADLPIQDIQQFLGAEECEKSSFIHKWRKEVETKLSLLQVAKQYLGGLQPATESGIHLIKWEHETTFIWFKHTVKRKKYPFADFIDEDRQNAARRGIAVQPGAFIKTLEAKGHTMTGEVGFRIEGNSYPSLEKRKGVYIETIGPTLFALMEVSTSNEFLCFNYMHLLRKYGFQPTGQKMEKYEESRDDTFQLMIPVMQNS